MESGNSQRMRSKLTILAFILFLLSRLYAYSTNLMNISISPDTLQGTTDFISVGLGLLALIILLWLAYHAPNKKRILNNVSFPLLILCLLLSVWLLISFVSEGLTETLYSPVSPIGYAPIFLILLGGDDRCWVTIKKTAVIFAVIYLGLAYSYFFACKDLILQNGNTPVVTFMVSAFWWIAVSTLNFKQNGKLYKVVIFILIVCFAALSFSVTYRSWIIQSVLLLLTLGIQIGKRANSRFISICIMALGITFGAYYFATSEKWSKEQDRLTEKNKMDTRGFQYSEMIEQVPIEEWVIGGGLNATYRSSVGGQEYKYIDNAYLFTAFHYGIFVLIAWVIIWSKGIYQLFRIRSIPLRRKNVMFICILWLFALGGLSVYNVIVNNSQNCLMSIALGRCFYLSVKR